MAGRRGGLTHRVLIRFAGGHQVDQLVDVAELFDAGIGYLVTRGHRHRFTVVFERHLGQ